MTPFASTFERSLVAKSDSTEIRGGWGAGESAGFALVRGSGHADDQVPRGGHVHAVRARRRRRRGRARRRLVPAAGTALGVVHDGWYLSRYSLNSRFFATNSREHLRLSLSLSPSREFPVAPRVGSQRSRECVSAGEKKPPRHLPRVCELERDGIVLSPVSCARAPTLRSSLLSKCVAKSVLQTRCPIYIHTTV